jgi:hypothetical protein
MRVSELKKILEKIPEEKHVIIIFEACDYSILCAEDIVEKSNAVFINADQSPIDWDKVA